MINPPTRSELFDLVISIVDHRHIRTEREREILIQLIEDGKQKYDPILDNDSIQHSKRLNEKGK